jgi:Flp pilus assembly protein TadD
LIYFSSINSSFHLDDFINFAKNPDAKITDLSLSTLKKAAFTDATAAGGSRPLARLSFAINYYFGGESTTSYHVVNIIIHALNAFLIYLVILTLFGYDTADDEKKGKLALSAFFTAIYWLVTPFNSQAVIYVVQRMTLMMTLFFLLAFLFYVKGRKRKNAKYFILSVVFFMLSFLSKQNALIFPLIIVLYELIFERGGDLKSVTKNERIILIILTIILFSPLIIFWDLIDNLFMTSADIWGFTYYERELTQFRVLVFYFSLMILPIPGRLSIIHDIVKSTSLFSPVTTFFSIIFVSGLFVVAILRIKKSPYFSFALLWFFITMSVEAILPIQLMFEHRMYLPGIFLIGVSINYVTEKFYGKNGRAVISTFCAIVIIWGVLTAIRGKTWENEITLWSDVSAKYPKNVMSQNNIGNAYIALNDYDQAEKHYLKAIELNDQWYLPHLNLGVVFSKRGNINRAIAKFKKALSLSPDTVLIHMNLGGAYYILEDYENTLKSYDNALRLDPENPNIYNAIGAVYGTLGDYKKAVDYFNKTLYYDPNNINAKRNLSKVKTRQMNVK